MARGKPIWSGDGAGIRLPRVQRTIEIALQVSLSTNAPVDIRRDQAARDCIAQDSCIVNPSLMKKRAEDRI